jgi:hypothetical protein
MHNIAWRARKMLARYGRSVAEQQARAEYHRVALEDDFWRYARLA